MSIKGQQERLPQWMKVPLPHGKDYSQVKNLIEKHRLHTICSSGKCPNKGECWSAGTATFMILGDKCTRNCSFCHVKSMMPDSIDWTEPLKVANTIKILNLKHCVITSVTRDDLKDGGASFWAETIRTIRRENPNITMEVLIPDFRGKKHLLDIIIEEKPEVISHNMETVERLTPVVRSLATYQNSLEVLSYIAENGIVAKSGIMLGMGEKEEEVIKTIHDIRAAGVSVLTIGQYLPPSEKNAKLTNYIHPEVFKNYKSLSLELGFAHVESGALVRSSYHAERHVIKHT